MYSINKDKACRLLLKYGVGQLSSCKMIYSSNYAAPQRPTHVATVKLPVTLN